MGADILERLRLWKTGPVLREHPGYFLVPVADIDEAAAEIVRLRVELEVESESARYWFKVATKHGATAQQTTLAPAEAKDPAPAMPNGVEAARVLADFAETAPGRLPGRVQDAIATIRAADNRDAAGVEGNGPDLYSGPHAPCIHPKRPPAAVPAGEAVYEGNPCVECGEDTGTGHFPGCCLGTTPQPADGGAVAWSVAERIFNNRSAAERWREGEYSRNSLAPPIIPLYTHPPAAPVQAAPQEGEKAAATLRDALKYVGYRQDGDLNTLAERAELWMRESKVLIAMQQELAAHHSACELVVDDAMVERVCRNHFPDWDMYGPAGKMVRSADIRRLLTAALQHRGDSRGGEATP